VRIVFGSRLLLFGWLAGFYIVPEGLAAPYTRSPARQRADRGTDDGGRALGMVIGAFVISRIATPSARIRMMGWLAVLSCVPLIGSAWSPPLWAVLALWTLAGAGGAYQSGLYAVQGLGILAGAMAQL